MSNQLMTKAFVAEAVVGSYRIVKFGSADGLIVQAAAAGDASIGIVEGIAPSAGETADVVISGLAELQLGGAVVRGGAVTSDASGKGVAAAAGNRAIGHAFASGVAGDVIHVSIDRHTV